MNSSSPAKRFIIRYSGGIVKSEAQAMLVIIIVFLLSVGYSFFLMYQTFSPPSTKPANTTPNSEQFENN